MKFRGYEHGIFLYKDLKSNLSIKQNTNQIEENEEQQGVRRSTRLQNKNRIDYKKMDKGDEI